MQGRANGSLSARLETWPFGDVWDQLGAVAYRLRGVLATRWTAVSFFRHPQAPQGWSLGVERIHLGLDGEDWLVTGLGFGRSDRRALEDLQAAVLMIGGAIRHGVPGMGDRAAMWIRASLPVRASTNSAAEGALEGSEWVGSARRWAVVTVGLSWS